MTTTLRAGPWVPNIGNFDTLANLQTAYPGASQYPGTTAYCADSGLMYSDGTNWRAVSLGPAGSVQYITSGASATVSSGVTTVILNGVNTTFALTFPVPLGENQLLEVNAAAAVSVAFSGVATAPATTIKTVPSTLAAGVGAAWIYHVADTTWYRLY
jgi:hypothetical protein